MSDMLKNQINAMGDKEQSLQQEIADMQDALKAKKAELRVITKARQYNERLLEKFESGDLNDTDNE